MTEMRVTYYHRRPMATHHSVERVFGVVRQVLPPGVEPRVVTARFVSRGLIRRLYNICEAPFFQGDINHVTGDVHYVTYLLRKDRTLLTILDCVSLHRLTGWRKQLVFFLWYWLPAKRCRFISVISEATRRDLIRYLPHAAEKVRVIPCPVSTDFKFNPKPFNASRPVVLQIGTGTNKNLLRVVEALHGIQCHLRIIGRLTSEQLAALEIHAVDYSSGEDISDAQVIEEYCDADVVVFASTYEGFGLPILEAQATGRPVITSNLLSMPEVAGSGACLVDPYDVDSIRAGVQKVIEDSTYREMLITQGLQNVTRYQPETIAQQYVDLYYEMIEHC